MLWKDVVSQEAEIYYILQKAQGSSVPVFLGKMDLKKIYFAFGGQIRHMLIMGWAGESTVNLHKTVDLDRKLNVQIKKSVLWECNTLTSGLKMYYGMLS